MHKLNVPVCIITIKVNSVNYYLNCAIYILMLFLPFDLDAVSMLKHFDNKIHCIRYKLSDVLHYTFAVYVILECYVYFTTQTNYYLQI